MLTYTAGQIEKKEGCSFATNCVDETDSFRNSAEDDDAAAIGELGVGCAIASNSADDYCRPSNSVERILARNELRG